MENLKLKKEVEVIDSLTYKKIIGDVESIKDYIINNDKVYGMGAYINNNTLYVDYYKVHSDATYVYIDEYDFCEMLENMWNEEECEAGEDDIYDDEYSFSTKYYEDKKSSFNYITDMDEWKEYVSVWIDELAYNN